MALDLSKGQKLDLSKTSITNDDGSLGDVYLGVGWDENAQAEASDHDFDLDLIVLGMVENKVDEVMYFGNKQSACGGVQLSDDNTTGEGEGDDEFANITAACLDPKFTRLVFAVNIFEAAQRGQNFGMIDEANMRIVDPASDEEIALFDLQFDASTATGLVFGELLNRKGKWYFSTDGKPFDGDINDLVALYNK